MNQMSPCFFCSNKQMDNIGDTNQRNTGIKTDSDKVLRLKDFLQNNQAFV